MKLPTPIKTDNPIPWGRSRLLRWPTLCLWSVLLSKSTAYPSLCLSLNSFCHDTSRTWVSLSPETRCVISVGRPWVLAMFESWHVGSSSNLRCTFSAGQRKISSFLTHVISSKCWLFIFNNTVNRLQNLGEIDIKAPWGTGLVCFISLVSFQHPALDSTVSWGNVIILSCI